jgi:hypothetical protein
MKRGFAALAVVGIAAAVAVFALNTYETKSGMKLSYHADATYTKYMSKYGKSYMTKEDYEMRKGLFLERL